MKEDSCNNEEDCLEDNILEDDISSCENYNREKVRERKRDSNRDCNSDCECDRGCDCNPNCDCCKRDCSSCPKKDCCCQTREKNCSKILESIALEEAGIAHILNAEGEKIQKAVELATDTSCLLKANDSLIKTLRYITHLEQTLYAKLDQVLSNCNCCSNNSCKCCRKSGCD
ncbi:MAG TPA: hypothetical protein IAC62_10465 [Candidatus Pelethocola excrementipullorum]|nr:hypothetical protein [Candidatus Pelethocola excrementipullorum]